MPKRLEDWDKQLTPALLERQRRLKQRRAFLLQGASIAVLATMSPLISAAATAGNKSQWLKEELWRTLAAVQEHLFPRTKDSPGAADINAIVYLHNVMSYPDIDAEDVKFIQNGVGWLDDISTSTHKKNFLALTESQRETVLRKISTSRAGENWLSTLLLYIIEALLTAPVYGGNPNGIGWQWLQHKPGFPLPTADKMYFKL